MKNNIENNIAKFLAGEASRDEINRVQQFKRENPQTFAEYERAYHLNIFEQKHFDKTEAGRQLTVKMHSGKFALYRFIKVAAIFTGLLLIVSTILFTRFQHVVYHNDTNHIISIILPDKSEVVLDKKASLSYAKSILGHFNRKVNMRGRVFYHVTKDAAHPFQVKANRVIVTVLGTRFTVNEMKNHTQVFLTKGKVKIYTNEEKKSVVIHKTGEQVLVNNHGIYKHNKINDLLYTSWSQQKVFFNNCTVKDVIDFLSDSYDMKINLKDKKAMSKKLFGSAPSDNPKLIIEAISQIIQQKIEIE